MREQGIDFPRHEAPRMTPSPQAGVTPVEIPLRPEELVAAWRPDARRLQFTTRDAFQAQQRISARITAVGRGAAATITGKIASARRMGDAFRVELTLDETRVRAMERLLEVARGQVVSYQTRAPRYLATLPTIVLGPAGPTYMNTFSVSENGCGLAWSGPNPAVGDPLELRLGVGKLVATFCGEVRWVSRSGRAPMVGVRFMAGERNAWSAILSDVMRSGAPPA
jgi:hypothetical protein